MNDVRNLRLKFIVIINAIVVALPLIFFRFVNQLRIDKDDPHFFLKIIVIAILIILLIVFANLFLVHFGLKWYDSKAIKKFFPSKYLGGYWHYTNTYELTSEDGMEIKRKNTSGFISIIQTPFLIEIDEGYSDKNSEHINYPATWKSNSMTFYPDTKKVVFSYEVKRRQNEDEDKSFIDKRSLSILDIAKRNKRKVPTTMTGTFWNCKRTDAEINEIKKFTKGQESWPTVVGKNEYVRCTKEEFENRQLKTPSKVQLKQEDDHDEESVDSMPDNDVQ